VSFGNEALALDVYQEWLDAGGQPPESRECIGYIKPLLLGGKDEPANQEVTDMEVYWSLCTQLKQRIDQLPDGTRINRIDLQ